MEYPLEERTLNFGKDVVKFCRSLKQDAVTRPLITQLVRSGTSVGANYCEANGASSKKDFKNKIHICKKEVLETKYWIEIIPEDNNVPKDDINKLRGEAIGLGKIFSKIISTINKELINSNSNYERS
jgi:four helix bundle protein